MQIDIVKQSSRWHIKAQGLPYNIQFKSGMSFHLAICLFGQRNTWYQIKFPCLRTLRLIPFTQILEFTCNQKKNQQQSLPTNSSALGLESAYQTKERKKTPSLLFRVVFFLLSESTHMSLYLLFSRLFTSFFTNIYFYFSIFLGPDLKPGMDTEENRWNHYNEFVFIRHQ